MPVLLALVSIYPTQTTASLSVKPILSCAGEVFSVEIGTFRRNVGWNTTVCNQLAEVSSNEALIKM